MATFSSLGVRNSNLTSGSAAAGETCVGITAVAAVNAVIPVTEDTAESVCDVGSAVDTAILVFRQSKPNCHLACTSGYNNRQM